MTKPPADAGGFVISEEITVIYGRYYEIYSSNSFCSPDSVNSLKWNDLNQAEYQNVYRYYQGLIAFRKAHPALRMVSAEEVSSHIVNLTGLDFNVTGFRILPGANGEENEFVMIFNPRSEATTVALPEGKWEIFVNDEAAGLKVLASAEGEVAVAPISAMVLVKQVQKDSTNNLLIPGAIALALAAALVLLKKVRKK